MRVGTTILVYALLATAMPAAAQSCGGPVLPDGPRRLYDRSWIRSNAVLYGADERGVFKLRLDSNAIEPIGDHAGQRIENFRLSQKKRWLGYDRSSPFEHWLYDVTDGGEHRVDIHSMGSVEFLFSTDESRLAWLERGGTEHRLAVLDGNSFEMRSFRLLDAPDPKAVFFDLTWSASGDRLAYAWRDAERQEFYSVDAATGIARSIPPPREFGADEFVESTYLLGNGAEPGRTPTLPPVRASKDSIALERGANVRYANGKIVVSVPGKRARTIAEVPPGCGPSLSLSDAFDGRYVLYRMNGVYWVYGLRENRKAVLYRGRGPLEW
jgi:hypothetical protein